MQKTEYFWVFAHISIKFSPSFFVTGNPELYKNLILIWKNDIRSRSEKVGFYEQACNPCTYKHVRTNVLNFNFKIFIIYFS